MISSPALLADSVPKMTNVGNASFLNGGNHLLTSAQGTKLDVSALAAVASVKVWHV